MEWRVPEVGAATFLDESACAYAVGVDLVFEEGIRRTHVDEPTSNDLDMTIVVDEKF